MIDPNTTTTNWGRWGADDERGAVNLITDEKRLADLGSTPRTGKAYPQPNAARLWLKKLNRPKVAGD